MGMVFILAYVALVPDVDLAMAPRGRREGRTWRLPAVRMLGLHRTGRSLIPSYTAIYEWTG